MRVLILILVLQVISLPTLGGVQVTRFLQQQEYPEICIAPAGFQAIQDESQLLSMNLDGKYYLCNDIHLSQPVSPIGNGQEFTGELDGNGKVVWNLHIADELGHNHGLFSHIGQTGVVKNLILFSADIRGQSQIGTIAGTSDGLLLNIQVKGQVSLGNPTGSLNSVGGIVGVNRGTVLGSLVDASFVFRADLKVGGIAGEMIANGSTICRATGNTIHSSIESEFGISVGGIAGYVGDNCRVERANIKASVLGRDKVGAVVGRLAEAGRVIESRTDNILVISSLGSAGGIVGQGHDSSIVRDSYSRAQVEGESIGGIAGSLHDEARIGSSYFTGFIVFEPTDLAGGIVGSNVSTLSLSVSESFYNSSLNPLLLDNGSGEPKNAGQLQSIQTFEQAGWDISGVNSGEDTVWKIQFSTMPFLFWE